ncbi:MAG: tetratricopeptide repeat protein [Alloacidobacterium sp.]|jgi:protein O-GlcNAc transferase
MSACSLKMRLFFCFTFSAALTISRGITAQEPSPALKQADADYRAGVAALSRNDLNTAREDFEKVVHLAPSAEQGHSALGAVLVRLGHTSEGIHELEKALAIKPSDSSAQLNLALAYEQSGQHAKALPWFVKAMAAAHDEHRAVPAAVLAAYARSLAATRQFPAAVSKMKAAIAEELQNAEWHDELGSVYAQQQDWADAKQSFSAALALNPDLAMAHLHLGMSLEAEQQPGALEELSKAYELAPQNALIALELGQAMATGGDDEHALPLLRRAVELDPGSTTAAYQLALVLQRTDNVNEAIPLLQKAASAEAENAEVLTNLGMALCQAQRAKEAVPVLQRAVSLTPNNATAHQNLAAAYIQLSQFDDAVSQLRMALKLSPDAAQLHYNLGLAFKMQDNAADAIPEFESAEKLDPSQPEPSYALGVLYMDAGRYANAARELNTSLKLRPENGDAWATLGSVYNNLGQLPEAASALQEAIRQLPGQPDPHLTLATVLVKQNQPAEAAAERKKAADLMRANMSRQRAEVASNSGNSLLKSGKLGDAIVEFRDALSYDPNYSEAHMGLANALQQQGKIAEAAAERQKAEALEKKSGQQQKP